MGNLRETSVGICDAVRGVSYVSESVAEAMEPAILGWRRCRIIDER